MNKIRTILILVAIIAVSVIIVMIAINNKNSQDKNILYSGMCGEDVEWNIDKKGTLTISGEGKIYDYGHMMIAM